MTTITVAYGESPEIMEAALLVLREAGAALTIETIHIGSRVYNMGSKTGVLPLSWPVLERSQALLATPVETPKGEGVENAIDVIRARMDALPVFLPEGDDAASMLTAAARMLNHLEQPEVASRIEAALAKTLEKKRKKRKPMKFAEMVVENLF